MCGATDTGDPFADLICLNALGMRGLLDILLGLDEISKAEYGAYRYYQ
jgi:hypothetical protein